MLPRTLLALRYLLLAASVRITFAAAGSGEPIAAAAQAFGQDDDVTALAQQRMVHA